MRLEGWSQAITRCDSTTEGAFVYLLRCVDDTYYVGTTRGTLDVRLAQHNSGALGGYTAVRRPVVLLHTEHFPTITDAIAAERQLKGWSRAKKEAWTAGRLDLLPVLARRRVAHPSRRDPSDRSSG